MIASNDTAALEQRDKFFSKRQNKVDIISPVSLLRLQSVVVHNPKYVHGNPFENSTPLQNEEIEIWSESEQHSEQFEVLYLRFLKISYYLGITPYYINLVTLRNGTKKVETCPSSVLHTAFVLFVHLCTTLRCVMLFTLLSYNLKNPLNYFIIARTVLSATLCWLFIWTVWMKHGICKQVLLRLACLSKFENTTIFRLKWLENILIGISLLLLYATSVYPAIDECNMGITKLCQQKDPYFINFLCKENASSKFQLETLAGKSLLVLLNYVGHSTRRYPRMKLLVISVTLWEVCQSYGKSIKVACRKKRHRKTTYTTHEIEGVLESYENLKEISDLIRRLVGKMLVTEIVEDILYFSLEVQLKLRATDWFSIFVVFETWLVAFLAYYIAACAAEPIQEVSIWLSRDDVLSQLSPGKVATLHAQLNGNPVGLKGGSLFTVTKSFLANVVTVWLTYFIILLQFQLTLTYM